MKKCGICGKEFAVLWPELWKYKRGPNFLCSWKCLRRMDAGEEKKGAEQMKILTNDEKRTAAQIALDGDNPLPYLKRAGCANPSTAWATVRKWAQANMKPEQSALLPETFGKKKEQQTVVELVYDPGIAEEYRREQEEKRQREAEEKKRQPLEVAAVYSRVIKDGTYKKIDLDGETGVALCSINTDFMLTVKEWKDLADEITTMVKQMA